MAAAEAMLATLDVKGRVACLLSPTLAAHIVVSLRRSRQDQAVVAVCPDGRDLHVLLHCADFSREVRGHRLWFAWSEEWPAELKQLFVDQPGLATPTQFIRLPITPAEQVDRLVTAAQQVFGEVNNSRAETIARRRDGWRRGGARAWAPCVVAPSRFRLWDDAGAVLADALKDHVAVRRFDPDRPTHSSSVALLAAADHCDTIVAADTSRADVPAVIPMNMPWLTWVTRGGTIPAIELAGPADALVVTDPTWREDAMRSGWPGGRVAVGGWPQACGDPSCTPPRALGIVADTRPVVAPEQLAEFSSHQLLWDRTAAELATDPFALNGSPAQFLERQMRRHGVSADGFDAGLFLERLILPAYQQAIARLLLHQGLPLRLFGAGWDCIDDFRPHAAGAVTSRDNFARLGNAAAAFVHVWPTPHVHPIHRLGRPVVSPRPSLGHAHFVTSAKRALAGETSSARSVEPICPDHFLGLLPT